MLKYLFGVIAVVGAMTVLEPQVAFAQQNTDDDPDMTLVKVTCKKTVRLHFPGKPGLREVKSESTLDLTGEGLVLNDNTKRERAHRIVNDEMARCGRTSAALCRTMERYDLKKIFQKIKVSKSVINRQGKSKEIVLTLDETGARGPTIIKYDRDACSAGTSDESEF